MKNSLLLTIPTTPDHHHHCWYNTHQHYHEPHSHQPSKRQRHPKGYKPKICLKHPIPPKNYPKTFCSRGKDGITRRHFASCLLNWWEHTIAALPKEKRRETSGASSTPCGESGRKETRRFFATRLCFLWRWQALFTKRWRIELMPTCRTSEMCKTLVSRLFSFWRDVKG